MKLKKLFALATAAALCVGTVAGVAAPKKTEAATMSSTTITPAAMNEYTGSPAGSISQIVIPALEAGASSTGTAAIEANAVITPVTVSYPGVLKMDFSTTGLENGMNINLYSDPACTLTTGQTAYLNSSSLTDSLTASIVSPGTYYLKAAYSYMVASTAATISVNAYQYSSEEKVLSNAFQTTYTNDSTATKYHTMKVSADSLVTIYGNSYFTYNNSVSSLSANICNAQKVSLTSAYFTSSNQYAVTIALKKGTYYVATSESSPYRLRYTVKKVKNQGGAKRAKARSIAKKKSASGLLTFQDKKSKTLWYKINLKKAGKITLNLSAVSEGSSDFKLEIVHANSSYKYYNNVAYFGNGTKRIRSKKIRKGTYYLKVTKYSASDNGSISIKYVK